MTVVVETLGQTRELLDPALREAVARLDDHTRLVTSYHLGWCDRQGRPLAANPGKAVRPGLVFLASEAVCGSPAPAVAGAVAVELVHNFSLVHDDLMDRDAERRHRPTVWAVWGDPTAVLVGDAMLSLAHEVLGESRSAYAADANHRLSVATRDLIRGQVLDVAFESRNDVGLDECLDMAAGKTGSLLAVSAELGAVLGGAPSNVRAAYRRYGMQLGVAFQIVDDLLGVWGHPQQTGKPVFSDLRSRKKTLPITWAIEHGGATGRALADWLADPADHTDADLRHAAGLLERAGARDWATGQARDRVARAGSALDEASPDSGHREQLDDLARFMIERQL